MSDSETLLSDLCLKRTCLDASYTALVNDLENLDHCVKDIDDPLVAFTMMDVKDRVVSFTDNLNEYLMASKKVNDSLIDRLDAILRRLSSFEPEA